MKDCKHQYESKETTRQEVFSKYLSDGKYFNQVLEQKIVLIFCSKCGDNIKIYPQKSPQNVSEGEVP